jgi:hypothetical protein
MAVDGTERLRITSAGNVGIGTNSPTDKLEVAGVAVAGSAATGTTGSLVLRSRETTDFTRLSIGALHSSGAIYIGRAVEPSTTVADGFNGGITGTIGGGAWVIGGDGSTRFQSFPSGAMTKGSAVSMLERMRITSAGNVGIGATSPASLLEVQGGLTTTGAVVTLSSKETSTVANDVLGRVNFRAALDAAGGDAILTGASIVAQAEGTFSATSNATSLLFQTGSSEAATTKMTLTSGGNVGIGTSSPATQLHIQSATGGKLRLSSSDTSVGAGESLGEIDWFSNDTSASGTGVRAFINVVENDAGLGRSYDMTFGTGTTGTATEKMRITSAGNVGIGTTSPAAKLSVDGSAIFNESGADVDFRIESDISTHAFFLEGSSGNVGIGTSSPSASAILDVQSTTKGVRMPNMTTTEKNAISSPAAGLMVYDTTLAKLCVYTTAWETITSL